MNQTMKIAVALIVAAGLSTMVYAIPEQRAMAHPDPSDVSDSDAIPFVANNPDPTSKSDPPVGTNNDPPPPGAGPPFGPNCVGCISTQNLANGAVTTPKIAPGAVSITTQAVETATDIIPPGKDGTAIATCPQGTILTGGGYGGAPPLDMFGSSPSGPFGGPPTGWSVQVENPSGSGTSQRVAVYAVCTTIHP